MSKHRYRWSTQFKAAFRARLLPWLLRLAAPLLAVKRWLRPYKISLTRVTGPVAGASDEFTILIGVDTPQNKNYLLKLAFGEAAAGETILGQFRLRDVMRGPSPPASLVVLETTQAKHEAFDDGSWFFIPNWVSGEVALPVSEKTLRQDSIKSTFRKIRKFGFEYEIVTGEERYREYYRTMYLPFMQRQHGNRAFTDSLSERRAEAENFELLLLRRRAEPARALAGCMIIYEPAGARLWSFGVLDGNLELVQQGVLAAMYVFSFEHLAGKGCTKVNLGGSRPFLQDGVLKFKRKFSQLICAGRWEGFSLKINSLDAVTKTFLLNNPFIFGTSNRLRGAVFTEEILTPELVDRLDHDFYHAGLERLIIYTFRAGEAFTVAGLPPDLAARIEIRSAADLVAQVVR